MTCVVGVVKDGIVYMGADSAESAGWSIRDTDQKIFKVGEFLIGQSGSVRAGQLVQYMMSVERQSARTDDMCYMVMVFAESVRTVQKEHGKANIESNKEDSNLELLIGYRGNLYRLYGDYTIRSCKNGFDAIGSGGDFAVGVLAALSDLSPKKRIRKALKISAQYALEVRGPFYVVKSKRSN